MVTPFPVNVVNLLANLSTLAAAEGGGARASPPTKEPELPLVDALVQHDPSLSLLQLLAILEGLNMTCQDCDPDSSKGVYQFTLSPLQMLTAVLVTFLLSVLGLLGLYLFGVLFYEYMGAYRRVHHLLVQIAGDDGTDRLRANLADGLLNKQLNKILNDRGQPLGFSHLACRLLIKAFCRCASLHKKAEKNYDYELRVRATLTKGRDHGADDMESVSLHAGTPSVVGGTSV